MVELHPPHAAQISDTEALGAAALLGLGLCQLPDYVVQDELARGKLVEVLPTMAATHARSAVVPSVPPDAAAGDGCCSTRWRRCASGRVEHCRCVAVRRVSSRCASAT